MTKACPPSPSIISSVSSTHSRTVSTSATRAPSRAHSTAVARPLPIPPGAREPAPVTIVTLPARRVPAIYSERYTRSGSPGFTGQKNAAVTTEARAMIEPLSHLLTQHSPGRFELFVDGWLKTGVAQEEPFQG